MNTIHPTRLESWCVTPLPVSPYTPPEGAPHGLHGTVYGHPMFEDGATITTTEVAGLVVDGDNIVARTRSGTQYVLGAVDPKYEMAYPNSRQRLVNAYAGAA